MPTIDQLAEARCVKDVVVVRPDRENTLLVEVVNGANMLTLFVTPLDDNHVTIQVVPILQGIAVEFEDGDLVGSYFEIDLPFG